MIIYKITNRINGKIYIGMTKKKPNHRFNDHVSTSKTRCKHILHQAMKKYGVENFDMEVLFHLITDNREDLAEFEKNFIKEYDCCILDGRDKGYNMTRGGEGFDSKLASKLNKERVKNGTHYFLTQEFKEIKKQVAQERIKNGCHNFQGEVGSKRATKHNLDRVATGLNPFAGERGKALNKKRIEDGTHNFIIQRTCPHCKLTGKGHNMLRYHFDNCKSLRTFNT